MREDERIIDQDDDFEVYERKRPRGDLLPGSTPDPSRGGDADKPDPRRGAGDDAPADPDDGAWLFDGRDTERTTSSAAPWGAPADAAPTNTAEVPRVDRDDTGPAHDAPHSTTPRTETAFDADHPDGAAETAFDPTALPAGSTEAGFDASHFPDAPTEAPFDASALPDPPAEPLRVDDPPAAPSREGRPMAAPASTHVHSPTSTRGDTMRIAIAATEFNYDITHMMVERAKAHAEFLGATITMVVRVPGVYDLPLAVKRLLRRDDVDGVATLGVVIEGETDHDDLVIQHAARKIVDLSLEHDKPVGLGITGPGMSRLQAEARIDRAKDAVEAIVKLDRTLNSL